MRTVIVIGGGASGMAAACRAAEDCRVILLEKNEKLGKKVYISGKGRCNLTNDRDMDDHRKNVVSNSKFLYSAYHAFNKDDIKSFLTKNGCPVKTERGMRVFPVSDHASDVTKAFSKALKDRDVEIRLNTEVRSLILENGSFRGVITSSGTVEGDACIICTGGLSYPSTGSTGDGYRFAESAGHKTVPCSPALVPLTVKGDLPEKLAGLSLKNVSVSFKDPEKPKKPLVQEFGEILFTHRGLSGPIALSASSYLSKRLEEGRTVTAHIDLKPALSLEELDSRILRDFEKYTNRALKNALIDLLPSSMIPVMIGYAGLDPEKKVNEITKKERRWLVSSVKDFSLEVTGTEGFSSAVITQGGVNVKEIDPSTMESKLVSGLYFAGEVLDVDALTGGYNLQIAWSTGMLAGRSSAKKGGHMSFNVAIDGPAGAGKSTIARASAEKMGFIYVDTGAMYRAIGLYYLENAIDIHDEAACVESLDDITVSLKYRDGLQQVLLNGSDVSGKIRTEGVGEAASVTSQYPAVREKLLDLQRDLAKENDVIMDGRDIGTTILPDADLKVFLTASVEVRAARRMEELNQKGISSRLDNVIREIAERDYRDMHREVSPLKKAEDAVVVDTSDMTIEEVEEKITGLIRERM